MLFSGCDGLLLYDFINIIIKYSYSYSSGCVVVVWSLVGLWVSTVVEIDCCDNCSRVAWLVVAAV